MRPNERTKLVETPRQMPRQRHLVVGVDRFATVEDAALLERYTRELAMLSDLRSDNGTPFAGSFFNGWH